MTGEDWKEFLVSGKQSGLDQGFIDARFVFLKHSDDRHEVWTVVRQLSREIRRQQVALSELAKSNAALRAFRDAEIGVGGDHQHG